MKILFLLITCSVFCPSAFGSNPRSTQKQQPQRSSTLRQPQQLVIRDSQGRISGRVLVTGSRLTFKNERGQITGYGTLKGNSIRLQDAQGRNK